MNLNIPPPAMKFFPYGEIRPFQDVFIREIYEAVNSKTSICLEGPNGLGKTIATLSAVLPIAEEGGYKVLYCTRTNRQADRVIEELKALARLRKVRVGGVSLRGRKEMCFHPLIARRALNPREAMETCRLLRKQGTCTYYENLKDNIKKCKEIQLSHESRPALASDIVRISKKEGFCPYELTRFLLGKARIIALSYLYVLDPLVRASLFKHLVEPLDKCILILDEAHSVPSVATEIVSDLLSFYTIRKAQKEAKTYNYDDIEHFCRELGRTLKEMAGSIEEEIPIDPVLFVDTLEAKIGFGDPLSYFDYVCEVGTSIREVLLDEMKFPRSFVARVGDFMMNWLRTAEDPSFVHILSRYLTKGNESSFRLEIVALDPRKVTKPILSAVHSSVSMSGTLAPIPHYIKLIGLDETTRYGAVPSPFLRENILALACKGVTTSLDHRTSTMYKKLAGRCAEAANYTPANVAIFAASYDVLEGLLAADIENLIEKPVFCERRGMSSRENDLLIKKFKSYSKKGGAVLCGVQGGRSSEGADYPGDEMNTCVMVGVPYAEPSPRVSSSIRFYEKNFPGHGYEYGYVLPAMRKASQAAGRPIRSLEDKGAMIFLDRRFSTAYCRPYLPLWLRKNLKTIPDEDGRIAKELILFWGFPLSSSSLSPVGRSSHPHKLIEATRPSCRV